MYPSEFRLPDRRRGSALVIMLSILVLIATIVLAFFSQSAISRKVSFSSASLYRADAAALAALDTITGDLRTEIVAGSQSYPAGPTNTLYYPTQDPTLAPCRVGDQGFNNLVKQSTASKPFWSGPYYASAPAAPVRAAAGNNTATPSANGRFIKAGRWNKPGLLGDPGSVASPQAPSGYTPPDWIIVTRQGPLSNAGAAPALARLADESPGNSAYAVGRYAYAIYDESALLDANVAGYPASLAGSSFSFRRGLLPQVDLGAIPGVLKGSDIVGWRNPASAATFDAYTNAVATATNGFTAVAKGDQAFVSRRDLLQYVQANPGQVKTAALPYLGTFTRDVESPYYIPDPNRKKVSAQDDVVNPSILKIRVQKAFPRADGTTAAVGEPLLKHRFPLSRLALFQDPTANAALIEKYFCMKLRTDGLWDYVDPDSHQVVASLPTIKTLDQVALPAAAREPTFWEVLQAGILTGSLGASVTGATLVTQTAGDASTTRQILSIGVNLIDQYDADDTPTVLRLGGTALPTTQPTGAALTAAMNNLPIVGVENVPYISWIAQEGFRDLVTTLSPSTNAYLDGYLFFALWNPNRNAATAAPATYRIRANGKVWQRVNNLNITSGAYAGRQVSALVTHTDTVLTFKTTALRNFSQISTLLPSDADLNNTSDLAKFPYPAGGTVREVGLFTGQVTLPLLPDFKGNDASFIQPIFNDAAPLSAGAPLTPLTMVVERQVGTNWIPCQILPYYQFSTGNNGLAMALVSAQLNNTGGFTKVAGAAFQYAALIAVAHSDPRTNRFGFCQNGGSVAQYMLASDYNLVDATTGVGFNYNYNYLDGSNGTARLADYAYNISTSAASSRVADPDTVIRKGDSNAAVTATHGADSPYTYGDARPVMLNRPFASVAEMGYAFRDSPWRSLNFSSADSADGGLLDLFCLNENKKPLRAGVVNLNSASQEVLAALLMNAYRDPATATGTPLTQTDATTIAKAIRVQLGAPAAPGLVIRNAADLPALTTKIAGALPDTFKFKREAVARSFADVLNARTWNLMIDVIAQSGRYTARSKTLNDFNVEGERRYWLHLAIDRLTGAIVDSQLEPVDD